MHMGHMHSYIGMHAIDSERLVLSVDWLSLTDSQSVTEGRKVR